VRAPSEDLASRLCLTRFLLLLITIHKPGRKDEVEMLKEELVRKDRQLELTERKLKVLDSAYADMSEKYASLPFFLHG
jgi:hypothetical protein